VISRFLLPILLLFSLQLTAVQITILNTTDMHGHVTGKDHGILRLASIIRAEQKKTPDDKLLLIDCGDTIEGTFESLQNKGKMIVDAMNYLKFDIWVPGNHDYDFELDTLQKRFKQFNGAILAANLKAPKLSGSYCKWKILKRSGLKIAVIGLTLPNMRRYRLGTKDAMLTTSPDKALHEIMPDIRKTQPDIIILAQHMGKYWQGGNIYKLAAAFPEIDMILGGHFHQNIAGEKIGPNNWFVEAGAHGNCLGKITVDFNKDLNKIQKISSELLKVTKKTPINTGLKDLLHNDLHRIKTAATRKVGKVHFENSPQQNISFFSILPAHAMQQTTNADAVIYCTDQKNYKHLPALNISEHMLFKWFRYQNTICTIDLSHNEFIKVIQELINRKKSNGEIPFIMGAKIILDNKKIRSVKFARKVNPSKIKVAFTSYTLSGSSGKYKYLRKLADNPENRVFDSGVILRNAVRKYIVTHPKLKIKYTNWLYKTAKKGHTHAKF
jgi:2',3'-cyclic-nucleotide 2'-phosphodiesterase (5'-nucleotidase family)